MNFNDPSIRRYCQVVLLAIALIMLIIAAFASIVVGEWKVNGSRGSDNVTIENLAGLLPSLFGSNASDFQNISAIFVGAAPLAFATVCFEGGDSKRRLNRWGVAILFFITIAFVLSALSYLFINPADWAANHILTLEGLQKVQLWARTVLSGSAFYLAALVGIKVSS